MERFDLKTVDLKGTHLIEAGAGTGKTYNIAALYLRLLLEKDLTIDEILVVTFTNTATCELKKRIRDKILKANLSLQADGSFKSDEFEFIHTDSGYQQIKSKLTESIREFDNAAIFTIHGFCNRILNEYSFETGGSFNAELMTDQSSIVMNAVEEFWRKEVYRAPTLFVKYLYSQNYTPAKLASLARLTSHFPDIIIKPEKYKDYQSLPVDYLNDSFEILKSEWQNQKQVLSEYLVNGKALNRNMYRANTIKSLILHLETYLDNNSPDILFNKHRLLTRSKINQAIKKDFEPPEFRFFDLFEDYLQIYHKFTTERLGSFKYNFLNYCGNEIKLKKRAQNAIFYDDQLDHVYQALSQPSGKYLSHQLSKRYRAALVDEFQDTDSIQYEIFKRLFSGSDTTLFLIGDPKQSIYSFRGADIFTYLEATNNTANRWTLLENWRSSPGMIKAVNTLFRSLNKPFLFDNIEFAEALPGNSNKNQTGIEALKPELLIWYLDRESVGEYGTTNRKDFLKAGYCRKLIINSVCSEIKRLLKAKQDNDYTVKAQDIAILVNTNNEARMARDALAEFNIPGILYSDSDLFESDEAFEILRVLQAAAKPDSGYQIRAALATDILGYDSHMIAGTFSDDNSWEQLLLKFSYYHRVWRKEGFLRMAGLLLEQEQIRQRVIELKSGRRRLTNILHLFDVLNNIINERKFSPDDLITWFGNRIVSEKSTDLKQQLRLDSDDDAVCVLTIHKSKGLEFPIVFCPFTWKSKDKIYKESAVYHDPQHDYKPTFDLDLDDISHNLVLTEKLAESLRMFYVAVTRAKYRCYLAWGRFFNSYLSAMNYLLINPQIENHSEAVSYLKDVFNTIGESEFVDKITNCARSNDTNINITRLPQAIADDSIVTENQFSNISYKGFDSKIDRDFKIVSYSYFNAAYKGSYEMPDHETTINLTPDVKIPESAASGYNRFKLPKGARTGIMIHEIMENLNFTNHEKDDLYNLVTDKIQKYGFESVWADAIVDMVSETIQVKLNQAESAFSLNNISQSGRINEMEFFFPLDRLEPKRINEILKCAGFPRQQFKLSSNYSREALRGFMQGYIDCIFEYENKFYIVDWKTNHLGATASDYSPENISSVMAANLYTLQYLIYAVALNNYLKTRIKNYSYEKCFGGVFYLFMRGIYANDEEQNGIFYCKPELELYNRFEYLINGASSDE